MKLYLKYYTDEPTEDISNDILSKITGIPKINLHFSK